MACKRSAVRSRLAPQKKIVFPECPWFLTRRLVFCWVSQAQPNLQDSTQNHGNSGRAKKIVLMCVSQWHAFRNDIAHSVSRCVGKLNF